MLEDMRARKTFSDKTVPAGSTKCLFNE